MYKNFKRISDSVLSNPYGDRYILYQHKSIEQIFLREYEKLKTIDSFFVYIISKKRIKHCIKILKDIPQIHIDKISELNNRHPDSISDEEFSLYLLKQTNI